MELEGIINKNHHKFNEQSTEMGVSNVVINDDQKKINQELLQKYDSFTDKLEKIEFNYNVEKNSLSNVELKISDILKNKDKIENIENYGNRIDKIENFSQRIADDLAILKSTSSISLKIITCYIINFYISFNWIIF